MAELVNVRSESCRHADAFLKFRPLISVRGPLWLHEGLFPKYNE